MGRDRLESVRREITRINRELLQLLGKRFELVEKVRLIKQRSDIEYYDPVREQAMLKELLDAYRGPIPPAAIASIFGAIFQSCLAFMEAGGKGGLKAREGKAPGRVITLGRLKLGRRPFFIAGPCAVESEEQLEKAAAFLAGLKVPLLMRAGAFKPRTSPYAFQGMGLAGLKKLRRVASRYGLQVVSEVTDPRLVKRASRYLDVIQIGARNMYNHELLREAGRAGKPVLVKRAFSATVDELLHAAEYVMDAGCEDVMLCERGIRTFCRETRFTLDLSAVALLRQKSGLPVVVDPSHAAGRVDVLPLLVKASFAAGAHGVMLEVHPHPRTALSDAGQQLSFEQFAGIVKDTMSRA